MKQGSRYVDRCFFHATRARMLRRSKPRSDTNRANETSCAQHKVGNNGSLTSVGHVDEPRENAQAAVWEGTAGQQTNEYVSAEYNPGAGRRNAYASVRMVRRNGVDAAALKLPGKQQARRRGRRNPRHKRANIRAGGSNGPVVRRRGSSAAK